VHGSGDASVLGSHDGSDRSCSAHAGLQDSLSRDGVDDGRLTCARETDERNDEHPFFWGEKKSEQSKTQPQKDQAYLWAPAIMRVFRAQPTQKKQKKSRLRVFEVKKASKNGRGDARHGPREQPDARDGRRVFSPNVPRRLHLAPLRKHVHTRLVWHRYMGPRVVVGQRETGEESGGNQVQWRHYGTEAPSLFSRVSQTMKAQGSCKKKVGEKMVTCEKKGFPVSK
jgi:hypothetical protein